MDAMAAKRIPCVVVSRNLAPTPEMIEVLESKGIPFFERLYFQSLTTEVTVMLEERLPQVDLPWHSSGHTGNRHSDKGG